MASPGARYAFAFTTEQPIRPVVQRFANSVVGVNGCRVSIVGSSTIVIKRRYEPPSATVVQMTLRLPGLPLYMMMTTDEKLTIAVNSMRQGSKVTVSGVASAEIAGRLGSIVEELRSGPMLPAATADDWYVTVGERHFGPMTFAAVAQWARCGNISPGDYVWVPGYDEWREARLVKGLRFPTIPAQEPEE